MRWSNCVMWFYDSVLGLFSVAIMGFLRLVTYLKIAVYLAYDSGGWGVQTCVVGTCLSFCEDIVLCPLVAKAKGAASLYHSLL